MNHTDYFTIMDCMSESDTAEIMRHCRFRRTARTKHAEGRAKTGRAGRFAAVAAAAALICAGATGTFLIIGAAKRHAPEIVLTPGASMQEEIELDSSSSTDSTEIEYYRGGSGGIKNSPATFVYDGTPITVTYLFSGDGCKEVGFMVFCDGQPVPYHTPDDPQDRLLHTAQITVPNRQEEIDLILTPAGTKGSTVTLQVCDIVDPLFDLDSLQTVDGQFLQLINGCKGMLCYGWPATVSMNADGIAPDIEYSTQYTCGEMQSQTELLHGKCTVEDRPDSVYYRLDDGEPLAMHLILYGGSAPEVTVQLMADWEPAPVFDGKTAIKVPVSPSGYAEFDLVLDPSQLTPGRHICALTVTPTENLMLELKHPFVIEIPE